MDDNKDLLDHHIMGHGHQDWWVTRSVHHGSFYPGRQWWSVHSGRLSIWSSHSCRSCQLWRWMRQGRKTNTQVQIHKFKNTNTMSALALDVPGYQTFSLHCEVLIQERLISQFDRHQNICIKIHSQYSLYHPLDQYHFCYHCHCHFQAGLYGVYADVPFFRTWIDETIAAKGGATFCS